MSTAFINKCKGVLNSVTVILRRGQCQRLKELIMYHWTEPIVVTVGELDSLASCIVLGAVSSLECLDLEHTQNNPSSILRSEDMLLSDGASTVHGLKRLFEAVLSLPSFALLRLP